MRWTKARHFVTLDTPPSDYLYVSIGSGVSILEVRQEGGGGGGGGGGGDGGGGSSTYRRMGGSSLGGSTFWGLVRLLTSCATFDEVRPRDARREARRDAAVCHPLARRGCAVVPQVIRLTQSGASANIDMLVGDIYGGDCPSLGLRGDVIAASFGKAAETRRETQRDGAQREGARSAARSAAVRPHFRTATAAPAGDDAARGEAVARADVPRALPARAAAALRGGLLAGGASCRQLGASAPAGGAAGGPRPAGGVARRVDGDVRHSPRGNRRDTSRHSSRHSSETHFRDSSETLPRDAAWRERPTSMRGAPCATLPRPFRDSGHSTRRCGSFRAHDVALSLLRMVSNNIGHVSTLSAQQAGLRHIVFGGALEPRKPLLRLRRRSRRPPPPPPPRPPPPPHPPLPRPTPAPAGSFIRDHPFTIATISSAVRFYSGGRVQPLFLKHDGFVGAIGAQLRGSALAGSHTRVQPTQPTQPTGSEPAAAVAADETPIALPATVGVPEAPPAMSGAAAPPAPRVAAPPLARSAAAAGRTEA